MIVAELRDGQDWHVGGQHMVVVDGYRFSISDIVSIHLRGGEVGVATGALDGKPAKGICFTDPQTGVRVIYELVDEMATLLGEDLTKTQIQIASHVPADLRDSF